MRNSLLLSKKKAANFFCEEGKVIKLDTLQVMKALLPVLLLFNLFMSARSFPVAPKVSWMLLSNLDSVSKQSPRFQLFCVDDILYHLKTPGGSRVKPFKGWVGSSGMVFYPSRFFPAQKTKQLKIKIITQGGSI